MPPLPHKILNRIHSPLFCHQFIPPLPEVNYHLLGLPVVLNETVGCAICKHRDSICMKRLTVTGEDGIQDRAQDTHSKTTLQKKGGPKTSSFLSWKALWGQDLQHWGSVHYFTSSECQNFTVSVFPHASVTNLCHSQCEDIWSHIFVLFIHIQCPKALDFGKWQHCLFNGAV